MKYNIKYLSISIITLMIFTFNGCILDAFDTLTQELPYSLAVSVTGTETTIERSITVNLNDNNFYANNQSKINNIRLVKIAYKTRFVSPDNLQGNIFLIVTKSDGTILFSKNIPGAQPSAYLVNPYELNFTQEELQVVNQYFSQLSNRQFMATIRITDLPAGTKTLDAEIFAVFEMDYNL